MLLIPTNILVSYWLEFSAEDLRVKPFDGVKPFLLTLKLKLKRDDSIWFLKTPIGKNSLSRICKDLIEGTTRIKSKGCIFSNKTPRYIGILRMKHAQFPVEKGICITRHMCYLSCIVGFASQVLCCSFGCCLYLYVLSIFFLFCKDAKNYAKYKEMDSKMNHRAY
jgi:hypothetical protein